MRFDIGILPTNSAKNSKYYVILIYFDLFCIFLWDVLFHVISLEMEENDKKPNAHTTTVGRSTSALAAISRQQSTRNHGKPHQHVLQKMDINSGFTSFQLKYIKIFEIYQTYNIYYIHYIILYMIKHHHPSEYCMDVGQGSPTFHRTWNKGLKDRVLKYQRYPKQWHEVIGCLQKEWQTYIFN